MNSHSYLLLTYFAAYINDYLSAYCLGSVFIDSESNRDNLERSEERWFCLRELVRKQTGDEKETRMHDSTICESI
jgi:hypothetical protein